MGVKPRSVIPENQEKEFQVGKNDHLYQILPTGQTR